MKENTAAVHAQVPVDVATFLLNEKRSEFHAIEQRLKVNVVLIPNMHLETPNYAVSRLRHDELNQMEPLPASYRMVEQPSEPREVEVSEAKPARPQAAVQGVTPEQPAPMPAAVSESPAVRPSILQKIFGWLTRKPEEIAEPVKAKPREPRRSQREAPQRRDRRPGRDREEGGAQGQGARQHGGEGRRPQQGGGQQQRRPERERGHGERPERATRADRGDRGERPERNAQGLLEGGARADTGARIDTGARTDAGGPTQSERRERPERPERPERGARQDRERPDRADRAERQEYPRAEQSLQDEAASGEGRGRRRRGRRGRGEGGEARSVDQGDIAVAAGARAAADQVAESVDTPAEEQRADASVTSEAPVPVLSPTLEVQESVDYGTTLAVAPQDMPAQEETLQIPAPPPAPPAPIILADAGIVRAVPISYALPPDMEQIETSRAQNADTPEPQLEEPRQPRRSRRPRPEPLPQEPMVQIETRNEP